MSQKRKLILILISICLFLSAVAAVFQFIGLGDMVFIPSVAAGVCIGDTIGVILGLQVAVKNSKK